MLTYDWIIEASNPSTTAARLQELAAYRELQPIIAKNPNAPLELLLSSLWESFPEAALENPLLELLLLEDPERLVERSWRTFQAIISLPKVPERLLYIALGSNYAHARVLAKHPRLPIEVARALARHENPYARMRIAESDATTIFSAIESILVEDTNVDVLLTLAKNPNLSCGAMERLAASEHAEVRRAIVRRSALDTRLFERFSADPHPLVVEALAEKPELSAAQLAELAAHDEVRVRARVLPRLALNEELFARLAADLYPAIVRALAKNTGLLAAQLEVLSWHVDSEVRENVAANPKTAPHVLERLAQDRVRNVLLAVRENPSCPKQLKKSLQGVPPITPWRGDALQPLLIGDSGRLLPLPAAREEEVLLLG